MPFRIYNFQPSATKLVKLSLPLTPPSPPPLPPPLPPLSSFYPGQPSFRFKFHNDYPSTTSTPYTQAATSADHQQTCTILQLNSHCVGARGQTVRRYWRGPDGMHCTHSLTSSGFCLCGVWPSFEYIQNCILTHSPGIGNSTGSCFQGGCTGHTRGYQSSFN